MEKLTVYRLFNLRIMARRVEVGEHITVPGIHIHPEDRHYWVDNVGIGANVYGTHQDYRYRWDEDSKQWIKSVIPRTLALSGSTNMNQIWTDWTSVGNDFLQTGNQLNPLTARQTKMMMDKCDPIVSKWVYRLGVGGFGDVWKAEYKRKNQILKKNEDGVTELVGEEWNKPSVAACKVLRLKEMYRIRRAVLAQVINIMLRDMHALRYLKHKNIIQYIDLIAIPDSHTGFPYSTVLLLMELCDGDMNDIIEISPSSVPQSLCHKWMKDIASGLLYMHKKNMTHMDIKPANILFKWAIPGTVLTMANLKQQYKSMIFKLGDLGTCQSYREDQEAMTTELCGTRTYRAPEMDRLQKVVRSERTAIYAKPCDIYSLGATLCRCLMTHREYEHLRMSGALQLYINEIIEGKRKVPGISKRPAEVIGPMIEREWNKRPTIEKVVEDLKK